MKTRESDTGPVDLIKIGNKSVHVKCGTPFNPIVTKAGETIYQCACPEAYNVMP